MCILFSYRVEGLLLRSCSPLFVFILSAFTIVEVMLLPFYCSCSYYESHLHIIENERTYIGKRAHI